MNHLPTHGREWAAMIELGQWLEARKAEREALPVIEVTEIPELVVTDVPRWLHSIH